MRIERDAVEPVRPAHFGRDFGLLLPRLTRRFQIDLVGGLRLEEVGPAARAFEAVVDGEELQRMIRGQRCIRCKLIGARGRL